MSTSMKNQLVASLCNSLSLRVKKSVCAVCIQPTEKFQLHPWTSISINNHLYIKHKQKRQQSLMLILKLKTKIKTIQRAPNNENLVKTPLKTSLAL